MAQQKNSNSIEVYLDANFLDRPIFVGTLLHERIAGNALYTFMADSGFASRFPSLSLSADIPAGIQTSYAKSDIFRCFGDCLPDRWGRALIDKRERIRVGKNGTPRTFDDYGYLTQLDDFCRMGSFRFVENGNLIGGSYEGKRNVPILADLDRLLYEARHFEESEAEHVDIETEWIGNIWRQGSSLGGARPKANIIDTHGNLAIVKFPSIKDTYDVALWEHFAITLARRCGIETPETNLLQDPRTKYHALLSKRFDRDGERRIHFASAITLTGLVDGDSATTNRGYLDIVQAMISRTSFSSPETALKQLYRRIAFNILIGNSDDHFRNHGFLLSDKGWSLSPAYDLNPTNKKEQSLLISNRTNEASITELYRSCEDYFIEKKTAKEILQEISQSVSEWQSVAKECGIQRNEMQRFGARFEWGLMQSAHLSNQTHITEEPAASDKDNQTKQMSDKDRRALQSLGIKDKFADTLEATGRLEIDTHNYRPARSWDGDIPQVKNKLRFSFHDGSVFVLTPDQKQEIPLRQTIFNAEAMAPFIHKSDTDLKRGLGLKNNGPKFKK